MFWRNGRSNSWRNTRRRQDASPPLAGGLPCDLEGGSSHARRTVEAYLAFVRAEYDEMSASPVLDAAKRPIANDLQNLGGRQEVAAVAHVEG